MKPLFELGQIVATSNAVAAMSAAGVISLALLYNHVTGHWGDLPQEDRAANDYAAEHGGRIFSSYRLTEDVKVWVITEASREVTTILLPEDY